VRGGSGELLISGATKNIPEKQASGLSRHDFKVKPYVLTLPLRISRLSPAENPEPPKKTAADTLRTDGYQPLPEHDVMPLTFTNTVPNARN